MKWLATYYGNDGSSRLKPGRSAAFPTEVRDRSLEWMNYRIPMVWSEMAGYILWQWWIPAFAGMDELLEYEAVMDYSFPD